MPALIWSDSDGVLGSVVRTGRPYFISAEEHRDAAEALDQRLDDLLDMAWHALTLITARKDDKPRFNSFEQVWVLGRAVHISGILRHEAMQGEERFLLWQALTAKAWHGVCHDLEREPRWRALIPSRKKQWRTNRNSKRLDRLYDFLEIGYWLRHQQLHDAGEVFGWNFNNANQLYRRSALRSIQLRRAVLRWLRRQSPEVREALAKSGRGKPGFELIPKTLQKRFPATGPGSALLPQHYPEAELREIVRAVLDRAREQRFS